MLEFKLWLLGDCYSLPPKITSQNHTLGQAHRRCSASLFQLTLNLIFSCVHFGDPGLRVWLVPLVSCYFSRYSMWLTGSCHSNSLHRVTLLTPGMESRDQQALDAGSTTNELSNPEIPFQRSGNPIQTVRWTEIVHWVRPLGIERSSHPVSGVLSS